ncbi:MobF family relaxase [Kordiimonas lacus]|uniref:Conjugative relaxase domain-containing protein, TrwC/TraI family n=1 Tax=Kordiimonas lacus TaxID=637679 RepID=A0A1G7BJ97_9PROT|nr:MobF family relaxase [Kordiimonas lacus]SDE27181.1 conjugative relaxase domain-containing protein, TrwC/TraI family [Kordiimonas lacus]
MVATISARKSISAAAKYYAHLKQDDYYTATDESGYWHGQAAKFLDLTGAVTREAFRDALNGRRPLDGELLVPSGKNSKTHQPGWDICLSAPKAVSLAWALAPDDNARRLIHEAHRKAVQTTCAEIEAKHGLCRRGKGGRKRESVAGLLFAVFDHKTSRSLCPQLHSHVFTFNMAPRKDASWGAILSKPLYQAQKEIGAAYRNHLQRELATLGLPVRSSSETLYIDGISRDAEVAFSVRRQQILDAMTQYDYARTATGFEKAALRSRQKKQSIPLPILLRAWSDRAGKIGLGRNLLKSHFEQLKRQEQKQARPSLTFNKAAIRALVKVSKRILNRSALWAEPKKLVNNAARSLVQMIKGRSLRMTLPTDRAAKNRRLRSN